jgi:hypothetical protein
MAIVSCRECAKSVSSLARVCPNCGISAPGEPLSVAPAPPAPVPVSGMKISNIEAAAIITVAIIGVIGMGLYDHYKPVKDRTEVADSAPVCLKSDLQCRGGNTLGSAEVYCSAHIERRAQHAVRWTDSFLEPRFSRFRWRDPLAGEITYIGNKVEFQNGFGAFTPIIYECDLASDEKTVLGVRVQEGRL